MWIFCSLFWRLGPPSVSIYDKKFWCGIKKVDTPFSRIWNIIKRIRNPQGPRGPRQIYWAYRRSRYYFNPQGPRGPRLVNNIIFRGFCTFQSTRPSRASTIVSRAECWRWYISIHKALAGLDCIGSHKAAPKQDFNPQGPRGPRPSFAGTSRRWFLFQSTRPSRAST